MRSSRHPCRKALLLLTGLLAAQGSAGCTAIKKMAINQVGEALASGSSVYESDDDVELVGEALPFGLKLVESLLVHTPKNEGLLLSGCQGFTTYAYAYVHQEADETAEVNLDRAKEQYARARRLYLRAFGYGIRGLEVDHPGLGTRLAAAPSTALADTRKRDVPYLYWTAAALGLGISASRDQAGMLARLPEVRALLERALALDEAWQEGILHEFRIVLEGSRPLATIEEIRGLRTEFDRALELSQGNRASLFTSYAEAVSVRTQDAVEFRSLLQTALAIDPDRVERLRLANRIAQRRARWLLDRIDRLFLEPDAAAPAAGGTR
jgi:predicted anti-sigma-YlaC factor YlaD